MGYTPYFVGPYKTGMERDLDSYLIPEDAFPTLFNAFLWRGRVYKKAGYDRLGKSQNPLYAGRIGIRQDTLAVRAGAPQTYAGTLAYFPIEPGSLQFTDGITIFQDDGLGNIVVKTGSGTPGTINYTTGVYANVTFTALNNGASVTATYFVKVGNNSPVMGLDSFQTLEDIDTLLVAFDLTSAYLWSNTLSEFVHTKFYKFDGTDPSNVVAWTGTDTDFFDSENYQLAMFATNNVPGANFYAVSAVTVSPTAQITTIGANNFVIGDAVYLSNVTTNPASPNDMINRFGHVTAPGNPFTTDIDTSASSPYLSGGVVWSLTNTKAGAGDGIRWFDGYTIPASPTTSSTTGWVNFAPPLGPEDQPQILLGALLIFAYRGYLVVLNTVEGTDLANSTRYSNRARWSQFGKVFFSPPYPAGTSTLGQNNDGSSSTGQEWYDGNDDLAGRDLGGHLDAPVDQDIIAAEFIKDTLVVYFEQCTFKFTFTGNPIDPFTWERVNTTIGSTSTFSTVPFDKNILSVGPNGIYACDSVNIDRIDRIIPDEVFTFHTTNNNSKRIQGIRDFYSESVQWSYVDDEQDNGINFYPTRILYYNYVNNSFSLFKNTYTCFGHYTSYVDLTWNELTDQWNNYGQAWNSFASQSGFPIVVAGNQEGFVFALQNTDGTLIIGNDVSLVIQNITNAMPSIFTVPNHCLLDGDYVLFSDTGIAGLDDNIFKVLAIPGTYTTNTFCVVDINNIPQQFAGYTFGGRITIVDDFEIRTKNLNPFFAQGKSMRLGYADFYVENTDHGEANVQLFIDDNIDDDNTPNEIKLLSTFQVKNNTKFWSRVYFQSQGQYITLRITYGTPELFDPKITAQEFVLHGSIFWMKPSGRLLDVL